jgi:hypothetical protein
MFKRTPNSPIGEHPWTLANTGLTALRAQALTVASGQQGQSTVLAGLVSGGIVKSVDGGATWQNTGETSRTVLGIAVDPSDPSAVYAATAKGVLKSVNGGDSWALASTGLPTTTSQDPNDPTPYRTVRSIIVDPANQGVLYAAVGGVRTSVDGGANWLPLNGGLPVGVTTGAGTVSAFVIDLGPGSFAPWGTVRRRTDPAYSEHQRGPSWTEVNTGIPSRTVHHGAGARAVPQPRTTTIYAGTSSGKVYRTDNGTNWASVSNLLPGNPVTALAIELANPRVIYAALSGGGVWFSDNGGASWAAMNTGLSFLDVAGLVVDGTQSPHTVYAATLGRGMFNFQISPQAPFHQLAVASLPPRGHHVFHRGQRHGRGQPRCELRALVHQPGPCRAGNRDDFVDRLRAPRGGVECHHGDGSRHDLERGKRHHHGDVDRTHHQHNQR